MKIQHGVNNLWESIRIHVNIKNGSGSEKESTTATTIPLNAGSLFHHDIPDWIPFNSVCNGTVNGTKSPDISSIKIQKHLRISTQSKRNTQAERFDTSY